MKKKVLASLLTVVMMMTMVTPAMAAEAAAAETGYGGQALPAAPQVNGDTITVTPDNAQYTLDGAYGTINGKTIHFSAGDYKDVLVLNRPTKYAGSETQYFKNNGEKVNHPDELNQTYTCTYARTVENVTFTADEGATLNGFLASSGHVYGVANDKAYDYVREHEIVDTNNSYYGACRLKNVSFEGLALNGMVRVEDYMDVKNMANGETIASINDGIHFTNCTFKGDKSKMTEGGFAAVKFKSDTKYFSNVTVDHCTITNYFQGVFVQGVDGLAVRNNVIDNTTHNAIAVQSSTGNPTKGTVLIAENVIKNAQDRAIRFGQASTAGSITINNNFMINSGNKDGKLIKAESIPANASVMNLNNNYWNGKDAAEVVQTFTPPTKVGVEGGRFGCDVRAYLSGGLTQNADGTVVPVDATNAEAVIGNTYYNTLNAAVKAAKANDTITLCKDITTDKRVTIDKDLTLDFAGKTLKTEGEHSIVVNANKKLTVDHGIILNNTEKKFGIAAMTGSNVTVGSDMVVDTKYSSILVSNGRENDGFVTLNVHGTLNSEVIGIQGQGKKNNVTVDGATIHSNYFGIYQNGSFGGGTFNIKNTTIVDKDGTGVYISNSKGNAENTDQGYQTLNIENCNITGNTAVETKYTNVTVKGDTTLTATGNPVSVIPDNNGSATEGYAIAITHNGTASDKDNAAGTITIENGNFNGYVGIQEPSEGQITAATMTINGGYFTNDISDYVASGKAAVGSDKSGYTWMVKDAVATDVEPAVGAPTVDVSSIPEADQQTVQDVVESVEADGLAAYASTEAEKVTDAQQVAATKALKDAVQGVTDDNIHIYSQAYLAIEATSYDATNKTLTLDITPMVRVVASTADNAENITLEGSSKNAVVLADSDKKLSVSGRVEMNMTLPNGFADSKAYVQHKGYEYEATVQNNVATFINPHGFSTFTFSKNPLAVASIGSQSYTDLEAALKDAKDGQTITLLKDGLSATMNGESRTVHFVGNDHTVTTVIVNGQTVSVPGDYTYTVSTGGGVVTRYDVILADTYNGTVTASHKRAGKNSTVTITATPAEDYVVDAVTVVEKDGDKVAVTKKDANTYTFQMPASDVTVKATFAKDGALQPEQPSGFPFTDVHESDWFYGPVVYAYEHGIMNGTGDGTTFSPNVPLNRAMMAAVLYNMEGGPAVKNDGAFSDVPSGQWYTDAVNWAAGEGIVGGIGDGLYAPNANLTREQMASVLYRYAQYKGIDVSKRADLATFVDGNTVSPWATEVVEWAVAEKLINGTAGNTLQPQGTATRAQVATVLMNFCENVAK